MCKANRDGRHDDECDKASKAKRVPAKDNKAAILGDPARLKAFLDEVGVGLAAHLCGSLRWRSGDGSGRLVGCEPAQGAHAIRGASV